MASVCSCALVNTEVSLLYMWILSSLCSWMPWPHEVPCHPRWQCWSPNWIYFCGGISRLMCSNKHWDISSIYVNLILTVLVDALAPSGAMSFTVTMLISKAFSQNNWRLQMSFLYIKVMILCHLTTIDLFLYYVFCQRSSKRLCTIGLQLSFKYLKFYMIINMDLGRSHPLMWHYWLL